MKNNEMIISKPYMYDAGGGNYRLAAKIKINDTSEELYYEVPNRYRRFLLFEVSDCFLVGVLLFAMQNNYDMRFEGDLSEDLYFNIVDRFIPTIVKKHHEYKSITINYRKLVNKDFEGKHVGTGLSCGVDSFYTILKNIDRSNKSNYSIDTLTYLNVGSHGDFGGEKAFKLFTQRYNQAKKVAKQLGKEIIVINSNISEIIKQNFVQTHTFRTLSAIFALGKYFHYYLFSNGIVYEEFEIDPLSDIAKCDLLSTQLLSTKYLTIDLYGAQADRLEKIEFLSNYEIVRKNLNVCQVRFNNCCKCNKCRRNIMCLYTIGKLDKFDAVFDVDYFNKNKKEYFYFVINNINYMENEQLFIKLKAKKEITIVTIVLAKVDYLFKAIKYKTRKLFAK